MNNRVIALVDMDCFYCQVEARLNPDLQGKPMAVVQYNAWKGGGIIAVNYEARDRGVTRYMRGDEAKTHCPEIELVRVSSVRGKADLTKYREASREVFSVICEFSEVVQRASIDEAYIDLSEAVDKRLALDEKVTSVHLANSFVVGYSSQGSNNEDERAAGISKWLSDVYSDDELNGTQLQRLAVGAFIVEEMRAAIYKKTGFRCSAGIADNKIMAKLVCGLHKPNRQTVLLPSGVSELFSTLPVHKVRNLGGKFGNDVMERLGCKVMADLSKFSERDLQSYFDEKTGSWLYNIARGIDLEPVTPRLVSKSIGCCKQFRGRAALRMKKDILHWIGELANEISDRLDEDFHMNKRRAQSLTVSVQQEINKKKTALSRTVALSSYEAEGIADVAYCAIKKFNTAQQSSDAWLPPLSFLGISVGKFIDDSIAGATSKTINQYFQNNSNPIGSGSVLDKQKESEISSKQISDNIQLDDNNKCKGSFFERYFKNNKHLFNKDGLSKNEKNLSIKIEVKNSSSDLLHNVNNEIPIEKINSFEEPSTSSNSNISDRDTDSTVIGTSPYFNENGVHLNETGANSKISTIKSTINDNDIHHSDNADDLCVSPSEIFPDLNDIDKDVMSLLPSPLQRKIIARTNKNDEGLLNDKNTGSNDFEKGNSNESVNNCLDKSEDLAHVSGSSSNYSPSLAVTVLTTTAHVHKYDDLNKCNGVKSKMEKSDNQIERIGELNSSNENSSVVINQNELLNNTIVNSNDNIKCDTIATKSLKTVKTDVFDTIEEIEVDKECKLSHEVLFKICSYCKESVSTFHFQEHVDHHIALKLHNEWNLNQPNQINKNNKKIIKTVTTSNKHNNNNKSPTKRKRQPNKKIVTTESKKPRSILSFFAPK